MKDLSPFHKELKERAGNICELCQGKDDLEPIWVSPKNASLDTCLWSCSTCRANIDNRKSADSKHWLCLKESIWSEVPAVQVQSWRILKSLESEAWAQDVLTQVYLSEEVEAWAVSGSGEEAEDDAVITLDSNGAVLSEGDSVTIIKDLDVKGTGFVAKRGTLVKNIHMIDDPDNIEGRVNKTTLVLKTKFLKKA